MFIICLHFMRGLNIRLRGYIYIHAGTECLSDKFACINLKCVGVTVHILDLPYFNTFERYLYPYTNTYTHKCTLSYMYIYIPVCVVYVCIYVCTCVTYAVLDCMLLFLRMVCNLSGIQITCLVSDN